jgi:multiple antibiotic resistance protein
MNIYTAIITLILVMDPLGNIPVFLSILNKIERTKRKKITLRETFIAFLILLVFLFFGKYILAGMSISAPALSIAGGIILFLIAIKMIFPHNDEQNIHSADKGEPFIVPLAIPLIAGPSALAFVMLLANQQPEQIWSWAFALFIAWLFCTIVLVYADFLRKILGERGLIAIERLMGMILTTMAVQMFLTGVEEFFHLHA